MIIPVDRLDPQTLRRIVEEFITREGTDYGEVELSLEQKVSALLPQLRRGEVLVVFDENSETIGLQTRQQFDARPKGAP